MKASTKRRRSGERRGVIPGATWATSAKKGETAEIVIDQEAARRHVPFAGKLHPTRRRPLHALRGRALRRRVAWLKRDTQKRWEAFDAKGGEFRHFKAAPVAFLAVLDAPPRQIRQAARARRFA